MWIFYALVIAIFFIVFGALTLLVLLAIPTAKYHPTQEEDECDDFSS